MSSFDRSAARPPLVTASAGARPLSGRGRRLRLRWHQRWRRHPERLTLVATFVAAMIVVALIYAPAVDHFFIADDLTNLHFIRTYTGSFGAFWVPGEIYSAPVTATRYMPLHIVTWWLSDALFGDGVIAHHVTSWLLHAAVAAALSLFARRICGVSYGAAVAAGLLFAVHRLNGQSVVWISAGFRLLSTILFLAAMLALTLRRRAVALTLFGLLFAGAILMNPDFVVAPALLAAFAISARAAGADGAPAADRADSDRERTGGLTAATLVSLVIVALFMAANARSRAIFPDAFALRPYPDPAALAAFLLNLAVPFAIPLPLKLTAAALVVAVLVRFRGRSTAALLGAALVPALFWSSANYQIAPRYLYLPAIFTTIAVVDAVARALSTLRPRIRRALAIGLPLTFGAINAVAIQRTDLAHFELLNRLPRRLASVAATSPGARIFIEPPVTLPERDLAFFHPRLSFVARPQEATHIMRGVEPAEQQPQKMTAALVAEYWYFPWFATAADLRR